MMEQNVKVLAPGSFVRRAEAGGLAAGEKCPLVVLLHDQCQSVDEAEAMLKLGALVGGDTPFFLALPEAPRARMAPFCRSWGEDSEGHIAELIEAAVATGAVDASAVYLVGVGWGAFLADSIACQQAGLVAAFASVGGGILSHMADECQPERPVHALHIHGTRDEVVPFGGGPFVLEGDWASQDCLPALEAAELWAARNGCRLGPIGVKSAAGQWGGRKMIRAAFLLESEDYRERVSVMGAQIGYNMIANNPGSGTAFLEVDATTWTEAEAGCRAGGSSTLWAVEGAGHHSPYADGSLNRRLVNFLLVHRRGARA